ncbi:MAG: TetR/AcrR family transcriptional regulator [Bacteroidales bacterium]
MEERKTEDIYIEKISQMFLEYGIRSVSMDDIAKKLGISKKTIYQYFKDKEDIVLKSCEYVINMKTSFVEDVIRKKLHPIDEFLEFMAIDDRAPKTESNTCTYDLLKYYPHIIEALKRETDQKFTQILEDNLNKGIDYSVYRKDINAFQISRMMMISFNAIHQSNVFKIEYFIKKSFREQLTGFYLNGLLSDEGRKYIKENCPKLL